MNADEILKRDARLRQEAQSNKGNRLYQRANGRMYLANIAAAERALIEAVAALYAATGVEFADSPICIAYRALLAAMEEAQK